MSDKSASGNIENMALSRVKAIRNQRAVRWYVLTLPTVSGSRTTISSAKDLDAELQRRERRGEPLFEYFAPSYVEARKVSGKMVNTKRPLLFNYIFLRSSEDEIFRMKRLLPLYNFLPRVKVGDSYHFPYISDKEMDRLRWVARSYSDELPVYQPDNSTLVRGDRVRIISGPMQGLEAEVVIQPGGGSKDVMVRILDCLWVPLFQVKPGEYELIGLDQGKRHIYTHLDNDRLSSGLHEALNTFIQSGSASEEGLKIARESLALYRNIEMESDVMRCKIYSLLLPTYRLLAMEEEFSALIHNIREMLPLVKAQQSLALLYVSLYGCTDNSIYYEEAHKIVDPWSREESPKKSKRQLIQRLADYDRSYGHTR